MTSSVTGFTLGFSNSALRMPYALANLTCGHVASVAVKGTRYECGGCGIETRSCEKCVCGYNGGFRIVEVADPHKPEFRITQIGDVVDCEKCKREAEQLEWLRALPAETIQHARFKIVVGSPTYHFYRRDETSPTGVLLMGSVAATPTVEALLREKRISPLSPTEAR